MSEHNLEFLSLTGGFTGSSESTLVKMPHCWKSHAAAQFFIGPLSSWHVRSAKIQISLRIHCLIRALVFPSEKELNSSQSIECPSFS